MIAWSGVLIVSAAISFRPAHPDVVDRFDAQVCMGPRGAVHYRLHVPPVDELHGGSRWPLVVWFHGGDEAGKDNREQLAWLELVFGSDSHQHAVEAFVLAVQFPAETVPQAHGADDDEVANADEDEAESGGEGEWDRLDAALADVIGRYSVDPDRIYLAGISQGANRAWRYACRHRGRFAAILPMATGPIGAGQLCDLKDLPIWAFQSTHDGLAPIHCMQRITRAWRQPKGNAAMTVVDNQSHDCWTTALVDYRAWRWLLDQRRGRDARRFGQTVVGRYLSRRQVMAAGIVLVGIVAAATWRLAKSGCRR